MHFVIVGIQNFLTTCSETNTVQVQCIMWKLYTLQKRDYTLILLKNFMFIEKPKTLTNSVIKAQYCPTYLQGYILAYLYDDHPPA